MNLTHTHTLSVNIGESDQANIMHIEEDKLGYNTPYKYTVRVISQ